jgi:hypothetical protein
MADRLSLEDHRSAQSRGFSGPFRLLRPDRVARVTVTEPEAARTTSRPPDSSLPSVRRSRSSPIQGSDKSRQLLLSRTSPRAIALPKLRPCVHHVLHSVQFRASFDEVQPNSSVESLLRSRFQSPEDGPVERLQFIREPGGMSCNAMSSPVPVSFTALVRRAEYESSNRIDPSPMSILDLLKYA